MAKDPDRQQAAQAAEDVAPDWALAALALAWVLLVGGRWLLAPAFQAAGLLGPQLLSSLDNGILLQLYLLLLAATVVLAVLRGVRAWESRAGGARVSARSSAVCPEGKRDQPGR